MPMLKKLSLILLTLLLHTATSMAGNSMPIIAYMGVPNNKSTDAAFKDFRECGFDVSLYGYSSLDQLITACRVAARHGVLVLGHCPETHKQPEYAARQLMKEEGFFGYVLQDEPSADRFRELQKEITRLKSVDKSHCFYINILPYYTDWILKLTKTKTYMEYVRMASATDCQQISFDYYPIEHKGLRVDWYYNLEMIRDESMRTGKPFWGFVLSVPHATYPQPTMGSLRLQIYANLAYGAQAIQYFTYWTPQPTKEYDYHNGPITAAGKKTSTYSLVQKMNRELRPIADLFYKARVTSVNHIGHKSKGTTLLSTMPKGIHELKCSGLNGAIVSQFSKAGRQYVAIVNKDYLSPITLSIKTDSGVVRVKKDMTTEKPATKYKIGAGDILLFRTN